MKIIDKLKNALFEEEYVEVLEKPKKVKEKKVKENKVKIVEHNNINDSYEEEKPIAKRIIPQEKKIIEQEEEEKTTTFMDSDLIKPNVDSRIPVMTEEDMKVDEDISFRDSSTIGRRSNNNYEEEKVVEETPSYYEEKKEEPKLYQATKKESYLDNYAPHEYGNYEKQKEREKQGFKPSPIISPIYGIVEDTRFLNKEPRREVRITTSVSHEKMDIDQIRRKAFGSLTDDISDNVGFSRKEVVDDDDSSEDESNTLLDLSDDSHTPEVSSVTMGDALEYFEDLGLEYNNDYIDSSKMTRSSRSEQIIEDEEDEKVLLPNSETEKDVIVKEVNEDNSVNNTESENLFDLIDSMYE